VTHLTVETSTTGDPVRRWGGRKAEIRKDHPGT
jgi:hypothetical protein